MLNSFHNLHEPQVARLSEKNLRKMKNIRCYIPNDYKVNLGFTYQKKKWILDSWHGRNNNYSKLAINYHSLPLSWTLRHTYPAIHWPPPVPITRVPHFPSNEMILVWNPVYQFPPNFKPRSLRCNLFFFGENKSCITWQLRVGYNFRA